MVLYVLLVLATLSLSPDESKTSLLTSSSSESTTSDQIAYVALIVFAVYVVVQVALIIRWLIYWVIIAEMLTYAITGNVHALFWLDDADSDVDESARRIVIILLITVEALTIVVYLFTHYTYPWLVRNNKLNSISWWTARPGPQTNTITYKSIARFYTSKRNIVKYCGGLNADRQPHGYGMWSDTSYHGERLAGQWENGVPVGPFRSFEHGSGYSFVNIRVGFCHNRAEQRSDGIYFWPKHSESGLQWGVASVECSVSGGFFTFLPSVSHLTPSNSPDTPQSASDCLPILRTPADDVVFSTKHEDTKPPKLKKDRPSRRKIFRESSHPTLDRQIATVRKEALVLLHGYNCSVDYGMNRLAQLFSLGDFPSFIHPYVFSWPTGGALAYFQAKNVGSESDRTATDFRDFLQSLLDAGYTTLNIIAHSMGARVFFKSLNDGHLNGILKPVNSSDGFGQTRMELSTLTLCNPDYQRNEFVKYGGSYDAARRFCDHITLYADSMDGALFYLEFLSKGTLCGPLNLSLGRRGTMVHRDVTESDTRDRTETEFLNWVDSNLTPAIDMDVAIASVNQQAKFDGVTSFAYNRAPIGRGADDRANCVRDRVKGDLDKKTELQYLDMDVIDTTWMDNNVHAIRHNYFNINPTIVDDLRHLIVGKKRARSRPGLLQSSSAENVYIFLVAPSHVKNK
jgi:hypothetical protein